MRFTHALHPTLLGLFVLVVGTLGFQSASAQPTIKLSGLAYLDYAYVIDSAEEEVVGFNTFDFRRVYLTADYTISDRFDGRVRFEGQGRSTTAQGRPAPFIKDLYLRWRDVFAEGHNLTFGVQPPPEYDVSEDVWAYRSLDQMVIERTGISDFRDVGLRADGPILPDGTVRYGVMVGNGNLMSPEPQYERGKHVYGQLRFFPNEVIRATLGSDYKVLDAEMDDRAAIFKVNAFVGAVTERFRGGVEAFVARTSFDESALDARDGFAVSVFGRAFLTDEVGAVARYDFVEAGATRDGADNNYGLVALVYRPDPHVELMPNLVVNKSDGSEAHILGRFTVYVRF